MRYLGAALFLALITCSFSYAEVEAEPEDVLYFGVTPWETAMKLKRMYQS